MTKLFLSPIEDIYVICRLGGPYSKNCDRGLENAARGRRSVTVTVVRDRKIRTALRINQIVVFVTMPAWKKIKEHMTHDNFIDIFSAMLKLVFITWKTIQNTMTRLVKSTRSSYLSKSYSDVKQKNDMQFL